MMSNHWFSRVVSPAPREEWEIILKSDTNALLSHTPAWTDFVCAAGGYQDASRLYETNDGRRIILPLVRSKGAFASLSFLASLPPGLGIGGFVTPDPIRVEDIRGVFADLAKQAALRIHLCPNPLDGAIWASGALSQAIKLERRAHVLDLEGGFDFVWKKRFHSNTRNHISKAERAGLEVECDTTGKLISTFYNLTSLSVDRWARQQHEPLVLAHLRWHLRDSPHTLEIMMRMLGGACRIWVARLRGQPVAAILVLQGRNAHYRSGAMNKDLIGSTYANELLHRLAIEDACRAGSRYYHMGESGLSESLSRFKEKFGAEPHYWAEYRLERVPLTRLDAGLRKIVKRIIGFRD